MPAGQRSVAIIYGLNEGPALSQRLRLAAKQRGIKITADPKNADIIITHSGGCYFLPKATPSQTAVIANPVCGPRRQVPVLLFKKIISDLASCVRSGDFGFWAYKTSWNFLYAFGRLIPNLKMIKAAGKFKNSLPLTDCQTVYVINNRMDPWAKRVPEAAVKERPGYRYITLPGSHDDLWIHPEIYLDIIQS